MLRIGQGYDCHAFTEGDHLMLGGVRVPHTQAVAAHSDGDVVLHALVDALLGAAALGDIGELFPDTEARYRQKNSDFFLKEVLQRLQLLGFQINNIDVTVIAEAPKLKDYKVLIQQHIADLLQLASSQVSIKAKTNEKMGFIGRKEGIAALAVVLLR